MAVYSRCSDITSHIERSCNASGCCELSLPDGPTLSGFYAQINTSVTNIASELHAIEASIVRFSSLISRQVNNSDDAVAWECAMSYCINKYSTSVTDGVLHQEIEESWRNDSATYGQSSDLLYTPPDSVKGVLTNASTFRVATLAARALNSFMSETFTGSGGVNVPKSDSAFSSDVIHALYDTKNFSRRIDNLATSMTNNIRQQNGSGITSFDGLAYKTETYVRVRWAWFAYPAAIVLISLVYLIGVIVETTRCDVAIWKSSNLALIFHGKTLVLAKPDRIFVNKASQMAEVAKEVDVELVQSDEEDWKLVQRCSG